MTAGPASDKARNVQAMFTRIARRYDLMNGLMTLGMHGRWRRLAAVAALSATGNRQPADDSAGVSQPSTAGTDPSPERDRWGEHGPSTSTSPGSLSPTHPISRFPARPLALDIGSGTGDLAYALVRAGAARVVAADFSETMLAEARRKLSSTHGGTSRLGFPLPSSLSPLPSIDLLATDALHLPFSDDTFDCITNGFLLRNVAGLPETFIELHRVLRPGGRLVCLEITHPPRFIAPLFGPYFEGIVPLMGRIIAGDAAAYSYLPASVRAFPDARKLAGMLRNAGFVDVNYRRLSIGVVALHFGRKQSV